MSHEIDVTITIKGQGKNLVYALIYKMLADHANSELRIAGNYHLTPTDKLNIETSESLGGRATLLNQSEVNAVTDLMVPLEEEKTTEAIESAFQKLKNRISNVTYGGGGGVQHYMPYKKSKSVPTPKSFIVLPEDD